VRNLLHNNCDVRRHIGLGVFSVVDLELEEIPSLPHSMLHRDHPCLAVEREVRVSLSILPIESLVGNVPIVLVKHVHPSDFCAWALSHVVVHHDILLPRLHLVIIGVADNHGEGRRASH